VFPEVQEAMKGAQQLDPKGACVSGGIVAGLEAQETDTSEPWTPEWMNAQFFEKLAQNPRLAQGE